MDTLNAALSAAAALFVLGGEAFRFLREHRNQRKPEQVEDEN
ncbi:hypothetical protein ACFWP7_04880 [Streptomyces sp. NPDC058470]